MSIVSHNRSGLGLWLVVAMLGVVVVAVGAIHVWNESRSKQAESAADRLAAEPPVIKIQQAAAAEPPPPVGAPVSELAEWVRPHAAQERWLDIEWQSSLIDARAIAEQTNRPLFIWATNDPMGRC